MKTESRPEESRSAKRAATRDLIGLLAFLALIVSVPLHAQVPQLVNYQGRVAVGTTNFNGSGQFKFAFVNANGSVTYWRNSADAAPVDGVSDAAVALTVTNGLYSVLLGDTSIANMLVIPANVWTNADVRLRIWFNDGTNGFQLLSPDQRLAPNGYLPDGSVSSAAIASGAITSAKIAAGAVTGTQLAANAVQLSNITNGAVDNTKLTNSTVTVTAGAGLVGGGPVALGGSIALTNAGVTSLAAAGGITVTGSTGSITIGSNATSANTPSTLVLRDASGNFSAGTITGTNGLIVGGSQLVVGSGTVGVGTASPSAGLHVSSNGGDSTPQAWLNQSNTADFSRMRLTVGGNYSGRWDIAVRDDAFVIYSGLYAKELLRLDDKGLKAVGGLVIENRTSDPPPETGRIWLRTDL